MYSFQVLWIYNRVVGEKRRGYNDDDNATLSSSFNMLYANILLREVLTLYA